MDYLVNFLVWALATFGAANIVVYSTIFKPVRDICSKVSFLHKLINCILCMGFWVGVFWGELIWSPAYFMLLKEIVPLNWLFDALFNGALGSCVSWLIYLHIVDKMNGK